MVTDTEAKSMADKDPQLVEELLRNLDRVREPSESRVVHEGDEKLPAPMVVSSVKSPGYVYIYDTITGEASLCKPYALKKALEKKRDDGSYVFTTRKPNVAPKRGTLTCLLHKDDPNRQHYTELGLPVCKKCNLTSPYQVKEHMRHKHPQEFKAIEAEREDLKKQEERDFQRGLLERIAPKVETEFPCSKCDFIAKSPLGLSAHMRKHQ